ncbi:hypothetical protein M885DRAFT_494738 [Pelagophyceae sp. CCMP2097]|nr:hypothetical protein M885DRAFT_494738 [Pelagophyceae sp. CCMP2097]
MPASRARIECAVLGCGTYREGDRFAHERSVRHLAAAANETNLRAAVATDPAARIDAVSARLGALESRVEALDVRLTAALDETDATNAAEYDAPAGAPPAADDDGDCHEDEDEDDRAHAAGQHADAGPPPAAAAPAPATQGEVDIIERIARMDLGPAAVHVLVRDAVYHASSGALVCWSTFNNRHKGCSWDENVYTSAAGNSYDTDTRGPPGNCFNCEGNHWRKDCPHHLN